MKFRWLLFLVLLLFTCTPVLNTGEGPESPQPGEPSAPDLNTGPDADCVVLLTPENGVVIPYGGDLLTFSFTPMEGIEIYHLNILTPVGKLVTFELDGTRAERILSTFTVPGENSWYVEALTEKREVLCTSESFTFIAE